MVTKESIIEAAQILAEFFDKDPNDKSKISLEIDKLYTDWRELKPNWVKPRFLTVHHFTYGTLKRIISYCDVDTVIKLFDTGSGFVYNANVLSIQANIETFKK